MEKKLSKEIGEKNGKKIEKNFERRLPTSGMRRPPPPTYHPTKPEKTQKNGLKIRPVTPQIRTF